MKTSDKVTILLLVIFIVLSAIRLYQEYDHNNVRLDLIKKLHKNTLVRNKQIEVSKKHLKVLKDLNKKVDAAND